MSLNWNLSKIDNNETLCWEQKTQAQLDEEGRGETLEQLVNSVKFFEGNWHFPHSAGPLEALADTNRELYIERLNPVTEALIMATMGVELGSITEANHLEFYIRIVCLERARGSLLKTINSAGEPQERHITLEEVKAHIGLVCNVCDKTWFSFHLKLGDILRRDILNKAGVDYSSVPEDHQNPSGQVEACLEMLEDLEKSIEMFGDYLEDDDKESQLKLGRCNDKMTKVHQYMEAVHTCLQDIEAKIQGQQGVSS